MVGCLCVHCLNYYGKRYIFAPNVLAEALISPHRFFRLKKAQLSQKSSFKPSTLTVSVSVDDMANGGSHILPLLINKFKKIYWCLPRTHSHLLPLHLASYLSPSRLPPLSPIIIYIHRLQPPPNFTVVKIFF